MIIDGLLLFSSAQNITTGTAQVSTNVIDLLNARDMGIGNLYPLKIACFVTTGFTSTDAGTLIISAQGSTDNTTWTTYAVSPTYSAADLVAGAKLMPLDWSHRQGALPRYLRLNYDSGSLHFTPGSITSMLVLDRQDATQYPAGLTIQN